MATSAQILANRRNALRSTGPRSVEGKAVSRFNALKTGIQAKSQVIPGEDPAELEKLAEEYHAQFPASTPLERFLVDTLIDADWLLRRYRAVEARLWDQSLASGAASLGEAYDRNLQVFTRLHRRIEALDRSYARALKELKRLQPADPAPEELSGPELLTPELASFHTIPHQSLAPAHRPEENKALRL